MPGANYRTLKNPFFLSSVRDTASPIATTIILARNSTNTTNTRDTSTVLPAVVNIFARKILTLLVEPLYRAAIQPPPPIFLRLIIN